MNRILVIQGNIQAALEREPLEIFGGSIEGFVKLLRMNTVTQACRAFTSCLASNYLGHSSRPFASRRAFLTQFLADWLAVDSTFDPLPLTSDK